jgi:hypothetical protein
VCTSVCINFVAGLSLRVKTRQFIPYLEGVPFLTASLNIQC